MSFLFPKKQQVTQPTAMPVQDDINARRAADRQRDLTSRRSGRSSTILSRPSGGEAGTRAYNNTMLGSAG